MGNTIAEGLRDKLTVSSGLRSSAPSTRNVGDFFAPFFDVVFYTIDEEAQAEVDFVQELLDAGGGEADDTTFGGAAGITLAEAVKKRSIGSSQIKISSTNGDTEVFTPDADLAGIRNFKSRLTIDAVNDGTYKATIALEPPYFDAIKIIDTEAIKFGAIMEIQWGYLNTSSGEPVLSDKGFFTINEPSIRLTDRVTIIIGGIDMLSMSGTGLDRRCAWLRKEFECDAKIIYELARIHKTEVLDLTNRSSSSLHKKKDGDRIVQATDDFTFFHRLLVTNDVGFTTDGATVVLRDLTRSDQLDPKYTLLYYSQPTKATDIPMISFESNSTMEQFEGQGTRGFTITSFDLALDGVVMQEHLPEEAEGQIGGSRALSTQDSARSRGPFGKQDKPCTSGKFITIPHDRPSRDEESENKPKNARRDFSHKATAIVPGHPSLIPLDIVTVWGGVGFGVGCKLAGRYRITRVVHDIGQSGYTTRLELLRATTSGCPTSTDPKADGQPSKNRDVDSAEGEDVTAEVEGTSDGAGECGTAGPRGATGPQRDFERIDTLFDL